MLCLDVRGSLDPNEIAPVILSQSSKIGRDIRKVIMTYDQEAWLIKNDERYKVDYSGEQTKRHIFGIAVEVWRP